MNPLSGFERLPVPVLEQLHRVVEIWKKQLPGELTGIYLHGSIALRAFRPESGDLDLLAVVKNSLSPERRLALAAEMIKLDGQSCPLEMSAVRLCDLHPWKTPGNCVFHYSDYWRERYQKRLSDPAAECYVADQDFPDPDVTSYIRLIHAALCCTARRSLKSLKRSQTKISGRPSAPMWKSTIFTAMRPGIWPATFSFWDAFFPSKRLIRSCPSTTRGSGWRSMCRRS